MKKNIVEKETKKKEEKKKRVKIRVGKGSCIECS